MAQKGNNNYYKYKVPNKASKIFSNYNFHQYPGPENGLPESGCGSCEDQAVSKDELCCLNSTAGTTSLPSATTMTVPMSTRTLPTTEASDRRINVTPHVDYVAEQLHSHCQSGWHKGTHSLPITTANTRRLPGAVYKLARFFVDMGIVWHCQACWSRTTVRSLPPVQGGMLMLDIPCEWNRRLLPLPASFGKRKSSANLGQLAYVHNLHGN